MARIEQKTKRYPSDLTDEEMDFPRICGERFEVYAACLSN
jgi:hypothetical protein